MHLSTPPRVPYWRVWRDADGIQSIWRTPTQEGTTGIVLIKVGPDADYD